MPAYSRAKLAVGVAFRLIAVTGRMPEVRNSARAVASTEFPSRRRVVTLRVAMIELRVLGDVEVRTDQAQGRNIAVTQPKRLALLLYLALAEPSGFHSRDRLMALLWPESDAESARHALRNALHALRSALGEDALLRRGEGSVGINFDVLRCDALELRRLIAAGRLEEGLALWQGDLAPAG